MKIKILDMKYKSDPKIITAKFTSECCQCGQSIQKGNTIIYFPNDKTSIAETLAGIRIIDLL